jgi:hypothetical protein
MRAIRSLIPVPPTAAKLLPVWRRVLPVRLAGRKLASALLERHRLFVSCLLRRVATLIMRCQ